MIEVLCFIYRPHIFLLPEISNKICCCLIGFYIFSTGLYLFSFIDTHGTCILSYLLCDTTCNVLVVTCMIQLVSCHLSYMICSPQHISLMMMMMHPANCHVSVLIHAVQTQSHYSFKYNQQDATFYNIRFYCLCSTYSGRFLRPSSGARELYTQYLVCVRLACCYR